MAAVMLVAVRLRPRRRVLLAGALAPLLALGGWLWVRQQGGLDRTLERIKLTSIGSRYYGTVASWRILKEHPAGGAGAGTFIVEAPRRIPRERYLGSYRQSFLNMAHNEYAETAAELGALGLLALLAVFGASFCGAWRAARGAESETARALSGGLAASIAGVAVSSLADPSLRFWDFTGFFYAAAALAAGAGGRESAGPAAEESAGFRGRRLAVAAGGVLLVALISVFWSWLIFIICPLMLNCYLKNT